MKRIDLPLDEIFHLRNRKRLSYKIIGQFFGVSAGTIIKRIEESQVPKFRIEIPWNKGLKLEKKVDQIAINLGYPSMEDLVREERLNGKTFEQIYQMTGLKASTIWRYTPEGVKGIYVVTKKKKEFMRKLNGSRNNEEHIWRKIAIGKRSP